jgi:hypothetical protein
MEAGAVEGTGCGTTGGLPVVVVVPEAVSVVIDVVGWMR